MTIRTIAMYIFEFGALYLAIAFEHELSVIPAIVLICLYAYSFVLAKSMIYMLENPVKAMMKEFLNKETINSIKQIYNEITRNNSTRNDIFITDIAFVIMIGYFFHINPITSLLIFTAGCMAFTTRYKFIKVCRDRGELVEGKMRHM